MASQQLFFISKAQMQTSLYTVVKKQKLIRKRALATLSCLI